jgi:arginine deiminase
MGDEMGGEVEAATGVATGAATVPSVRSEVGRLESVLVHRPGLELTRITPSNKDELLFDELVWVAKAQEEHDGFADLLREEGVNVRLMEALLAEVLAEDEIRAELIRRIASKDVCGIELVDRVRGHLAELPPPDLVARLVGGLTVREVPGAGDGFVGGLLGPHAFLLPPLPNSVFTRDPSALIGEGVVLCPMQKQARHGERVIWRTLYQNHPDLSVVAKRTWYGDEDRAYAPATIEGGDILVLSADCLAVGISERTHPIAVENLAAQLFAAGAARWVLGIDLPKARGTMHLDTVLTVVDTDAVLLWPRAREAVRVHRIEPGGNGRMRVTAEPDLVRALAEGLGVDQLRVITTGEDDVTADREQWDDGNNTLALRPGVVIAYERNADTNRRLTDAGIDVRTISSFELPRGRGGPRCMSCPIARYVSGSRNGVSGRTTISPSRSATSSP